MFTTAGNIFAQGGFRGWWNSLSPEWKKILSAQELKGKDIEPNDEQLARIVDITNVDCRGNKDITDLRALAGLPQLESVDCSNTNIQSLKGIGRLTNLKYLDCSNNDNLGSLADLTELPELLELNCSNTMVKDLTPLENLKKLRKLDAHYCTVNKLAVVSKLPALEYLDVSQNQSLFSLTGLENHKQLITLNCSETPVSDLAPLQGLKALAYLNLSHTKVATLRPLQYVRTLREIDCSDTRITAQGLDFLYAHASLSMLRARNVDVTADEINDFINSYKSRNGTNCDIIMTAKKK